MASEISQFVNKTVGPAFTADPLTSHAASGRFYTDESLYELEQERVFGRSWLFVCHVTQVPERGDYLVREVADESLMIIRDRDDEVRVFYNVCQHRGHQLVSSDGHTPNVVVCPYHAWSYALDGTLRSAPKMRQVPEFCRDVRLADVRTEIVGGFVFVNLDEDAAALDVVAPQFRQNLLSMVGECDELQLVKTKRYDIAANWKIVTENFLEAYHVEFSGPAHQALATIIDTATYESVIDGLTIEYTAAGGDPETLPYSCNDEEAFTSARGKPFHQLFLYPNMTFSVFPGTNMLFVFNMCPAGPGRCAEEILYFALDDELSEPSTTAEAYVSSQLNLEDVAIVESVQKGLRSRGYTPGRLMIDETKQAGWREQFVHHFTATHLAALGVDPT